MQQPVESTLQGSSSVAGTAYTVASVDAGRVLEAPSGSATTITLQTVAQAGYHVGMIISICQYGAGQVTVAGAGGVTLRSRVGLKTVAQYAVIWLRMRANDEWVVWGDCSA